MAETRPGLTRALSALGHRDYRKFAVSLALTSVAAQLLQTAIAWQVYEITDSALQLGLTGLARAAPRSKANLVRGLLSGQLSAGELGGEALKGIADLCVNCHQCRFECPAGVDIPKLMLETKAQFVATNGLRGSDALAAKTRAIPWRPVPQCGARTPASFSSPSARPRASSRDPARRRRGARRGCDTTLAVARSIRDSLG